MAVFIHPSPDWPLRRTSGFEIMSPSACFDGLGKQKLGVGSILGICLPAHNRIRAAAWRQNGSFPLNKLHARNRTTCSARHYHLETLSCFGEAFLLASFFPLLILLPPPFLFAFQGAAYPPQLFLLRDARILPLKKNKKKKLKHSLLGLLEGVNFCRLSSQCEWRRFYHHLNTKIHLYILISQCRQSEFLLIKSIKAQNLTQ